jgi:hypothetical protein
LDTILLGSPGSGTISSVGCGFGALPLGFQIQDILGDGDSKVQRVGKMAHSTAAITQTSSWLTTNVQNE